MTPTVHQQRGLRQGDPLSPLLFNIALEPLLLSIQQDESFTGYSYQSQNSTYKIKYLAYADDVCILVHDRHDFNQLQKHINHYSSVSNAKFNQSKTEAFSISGQCDNEWKQYLERQNVTQYHHNKSTELFRYLGFHIRCSQGKIRKAGGPLFWV